MNANPAHGVFFPVINLQSSSSQPPRQRGLCSSVQEMQNAEGLICLSGLARQIRDSFPMQSFSMVAVITGTFPSLIFYLIYFTLVAACTAERSSCLLCSAFGGVGSILTKLHHQL